MNKPDPTILWAGVVLMATLLTGSTSLAAENVNCVNPESDKVESIAVSWIRSQEKLIKDDFRNGPFHVLDLREQDLKRRRRIPVDIERERWCVVRSHLDNLDAALGELYVDTPFLSAKFRRLERWSRIRPLGFDEEIRLKKIIKTALRAMQNDKFAEANQALNKGAMLLFPGDKWTVPSEEDLRDNSSSVMDSNQFVEIRDYQVDRGCPNLKGRKGRALRNVIKELSRQLNKLKIRPLDLPEGSSLIADFRNYSRLGANWPAIQVACVMMHRSRRIEIGLGSVIRRFSQINVLAQAAFMEDSTQKEFRRHIRVASKELARREYQRAHDELDKALILLGEPLVIADYFNGKHN